MKQTSKCNECSVSDCPSVKKIHSDCRMFTPLSPFYTPLLMHLLLDDRKVQDTIEVLSRFKIGVDERQEYPYFRLRLE